MNEINEHINAYADNVNPLTLAGAIAKFNETPACPPYAVTTQPGELLPNDDPDWLEWQAAHTNTTEVDES